MARPVPILLYHSVDTACAAAYRPWMVSPKRFARQMAYLAKNGYRPVSASTLAACRAAGTPPRPGTVLITFDDGLRDFVTGALPILKRFGFPATLFVVSGHVGGTSRWLSNIGEGERPMLNWTELRELGEQGVQCGAHTSSHPQLDLLSPAAAADEIVRSKSALEDGLGKPIDAFAYPHGYATAAIRRFVKDIGFTSAFRVANALSSPEEDRFALSRITMREDMDDNEMARLLSGRTLRVAPPPDRLVALGWRLVRRLHHGLGMRA
ncbi:hypothetical protein GCM10010862_08140 [Devosia nitrariae]|uniref:Chitooligosaccharide deacetylase n=2 Tax=Devosia nitrariae TaxID=2071872 RepID=A0ABQ5W0G9_9HYPH|nr:hypothetical protein GCM10010862_08140 [Devosia nitrariae]